jgi:hypothetical protein
MRAAHAAARQAQYVALAKLYPEEEEVVTGNILAGWQGRGGATDFVGVLDKARPRSLASKGEREATARSTIQRRDLRMYRCAEDLCKKEACPWQARGLSGLGCPRRPWRRLVAERGAALPAGAAAAAGGAHRGARHGGRCGRHRHGA